MSEAQNIYYEFWQETASRIKETLPEQEYHTWFNRIAYLKSDNHKVVLAVASQFILDTVIARYRDMIRNTMIELTGEEIDIVFEVVSRSKIEQIQQPSKEPKEAPKETTAFALQAKPQVSEEKTLKMKKDCNLNPSYEFHTFVIGDNSAFAYNASLAIAKTQGLVTTLVSSMVVLGLGKPTS